MRMRFTLAEGFDKIYHPLRFQAFWNDQGYCYLRVQIAQGKIVFTCAQLLNYYNTSITNAAESVRISAINALMQDGALKVSNKKISATSSSLSSAKAVNLTHGYLTTSTRTQSGLNITTLKSA